MLRAARLCYKLDSTSCFGSGCHVGSGDSLDARGRDMLRKQMLAECMEGEDRELLGGIGPGDVGGRVGFQETFAPCLIERGFPLQSVGQT